VARDGCPPLRDLLTRYRQAGGRYMVCPVCCNATQLDKAGLLPNAELAESVQLWEWIGGEQAATFSYQALALRVCSRGEVTATGR